MKIYVDTDNFTAINDPNFKVPADRYSFKRGDNTSLEIAFVSGSTVLASNPTRLLQFGVKESGKYDTDYIVYADEYTINVGDFYVLKPNFNTVALDALLNKDETSSNDVASVTLMGELSWSDDAGVTWNSTNTFIVIVNNDVIRGDEASPVPNQTLIEWFESKTLDLSSAPTNQAYATALLTFTGGAAVGDQVFIGSTTYTITDSPSFVAGEVVYESDNETMIGNLVAAINGTDGWNDVHPDVIGSYVPSAPPYKLTVTAKVVGTAGNSIAVDYQDGFGDPSPYVAWNNSTLTGGANGTTGFFGQMAIVNNTSGYLCVKADPSTWKQITLT